jgi:hypothetical protein
MADLDVEELVRWGYALFVRLEEFFDRAEALDAAGLGE